MATLYNNGSGNQSMGNMGAGMAAGYAEWQRAQLEGDPQAAKRASENYQKAEALQADPNRDVARAEKVGKENSDREVNKQQEKIRKEQEEKASKFNKLPAYKNVQTKDVNLNTDNKLLKEYGNNYFELITYDQGLNNSKLGGQLKLAGVLKDMPSFSMSCTWDKGPASSISDTVKSFMCAPLVEMMTTMGGRDRAWMSLDEGTDRVYKTTSRPSFALNFKLYSNEVIGSEKLTEWKTWLKALSLYTMPSVDAKVSINAMANNTLNGLYGCGDLVKNTIDSFQKGFSNAFDSQKGEAATDKSLIDKIVDGVGGGLETAINGVAGQLTERDGLNRVTNSSNTKNYYGAKLWYLKLLPGIFKKPLIVYISNWGVTYSKEINPDTHEPIWVDFTVNCEMDQIASAPVWMSYITGKSENIETYTKEYAKANKKN
jgi:hypothetical protein